MKKIISLFTTLCIVFSMLGTFTVFAEETAVEKASGTCGENVYWTLYDNGTLTISGTGDMNNYGYNENFSPFSDKSENDYFIKSVVIENGVTNIGEYVFYACSSLENITVPNSIQSIESHAFHNCEKLTEIKIPDGVTKIQDVTFYNCTSLKSINLPEGITEIGYSAFYQCESLSKLKIPDSVTVIDQNAFKYCTNLTEINIPDGVAEISSDTFEGCVKLSEVIIPDSVKKIGSGAFNWCGSLTSLVIPDSVTEIGMGAFRDCTSLTKLKLPRNITEINRRMCQDCSNLIEITIPENVTSIGELSFLGCGELRRVTIPSNITRIGHQAFDYCEKLSDVYYLGTEEMWNSNDIHKYFDILDVTIHYDNNTTIISTLAELEAFRDDVNNGNTYEGKTVKLTADIDMSEKYGEGKESWTPIDTFAGTFDGGCHTISGLYINTDEESAALFDVVTGTIKNLNVKGSISTTNEDGQATGIASSTDFNGKILDCAFDGTINSPQSAAGIVGGNSGLISGCKSKGKITGKHLVGGIASTIDDGTVINCVNYSEVVGRSPVGGITGALNLGTITRCTNNGRTRVYVQTSAFDVPQGFYVGGIAGEASGNAVIEYCYNTAVISGGSGIGGILGEIQIYNDNDFLVTIKNCYNTADVGGKTAASGILGGVNDYTKQQSRYIGKIQNCYSTGDSSTPIDESHIMNTVFDKYVKTVNCYYIKGYVIDDEDETIGATALTLEQFADKTNFVNWDFNIVWKIDETIKRPVLRSNNEADEIIEISTLEEFEAFCYEIRRGNELKDKIIKLTSDIDMSEKYNETTGLSWDTVGWDNLPFSGIFDGNGHTIQGLYINIPEDTNTVGYSLFGCLKGTIKNLNVKGFINTAGDIAGGIVAEVDDSGTVFNCSFDGTIIGSRRVGGITAENYGLVSNCQCYGTVSGTREVGGIAAIMAGENAIVRNCINESEITGGVTVGGISGWNDYLFTIKNSYNTGNISGTDKVGGITGVIEGSTNHSMTYSVENCYNIGHITSISEADSSIGSIVGGIDTEYPPEGNITNCYYLDTCISGEQIAATALTTEQFADKMNFTNWDFDTVWKMDETLGRPVFRSGTEEPTIKTHIHKVCGDENCTDNHENIEWTAWDSKTSLPTEAGNYYLIKDVEIERQWEPANGTSLCLNGHTITYVDGMNTYSAAVQIDDFTLCDCLGGGKITAFRAHCTGVQTNYRCTFNMYGGEISGHSLGVYNPGGTFNMYGGKISNNYTYGGVKNVNSVFNMLGGEITYNTGFGVNGSVNITVGGNAIIKNNLLNECPNNLILLNGQTVTVSEPLTNDAYIGVTYDGETAPTEENPVDITGTNDADYSKYFHSDDENYKIVNSENNVIQLVNINTEPPIETHTHTLVHHAAVTATCTETGTGEYWKCEGTDACNKMFADANGTTEIAEIPTTAATEHNYGAWSISTEPTLTTTGKAERICGNNNTHKEIVDLPILTDTTIWTAGARVEPTETVDGSQAYTSDYGNVTITIPTLGHTHDWSAWSITTEPTFAESGIAERVCKENSGHKDTFTLPILTDTTVWTEDLKIEPTETENGLVVYTSQYGNVQIIIPALKTDYDYSIKYENGKAIITVPQDGTYTVIFASYDNGRLLSVNAQDIQFVKGENLPISPQNFNADGEVKVMLWDSLKGMKPLCAADGN